MKYLAILFAVVLAGCDSGSAKELNEVATFDDLVHYRVDCARKKEQQAQLLSIIKNRNLDRDPETMSDADRAWNIRLKTTYWWFELNCGAQNEK